MPLNALETALELLGRGLWPVPITAPDDPHAVAPGKQPIGKAWGRRRHTEASLRDLYAAHPGAGVGLKLGPEGGAIDLDVDDPDAAGPALLRLFAGELPETLGWTSARGHHWLFAWDDRLASFAKAIVKGHPAYPGLEIRLGWSAEGRQYQSVVPPSVGSDGKPREWNGHREIRPLPAAALADLARHLTPPEPPPAAPGKKKLVIRPEGEWTPELRASAYLEACQSAVAGERGHDQTFKAACKVGPGFDLTPDAALRLIRDEYNPRCVPPWSEAELRHKVEEAYKVEPRRGWLLEAGKGQGGGGGGGGQGGQDDEPPAEVDDDPFRLARMFMAARTTADGTPRLRYWLEEWHAWDGRCYRVVAPGEVKSSLVKEVKAEYDRIAAGRGRSPSRITTGLIANVMQALSSLALLRRDECAGQPAWLGAADEDLPRPRDVIPARNGLVHLPAVTEGRRGLLPHTPLFFSPNCLDYDFDPDAPRPGHWLRFLASLWPDDPDSVRCLQEWFGYLLTPDTSQQKILVLIGPTRSGKGTIARVATAVVGHMNAAAPTLSGMARDFGLAPLIGKTLAIFPDARLSGRADGQVIVERLLSISGEDMQTIDRKHLSSWTGQLNARFVLISNELPRLGDSSGAITARTVILRMVRSFLGVEDVALQHKLLTELPSILLWSIAGWARLRQRGRFLQPPSALELIEEMKDLSSPVGDFIEERCDLGPELCIEMKKLYAAWKGYCTDHGRDHAGDDKGFGRMLRAALPSLETSRPSSKGERIRKYVGIALKADF